MDTFFIRIAKDLSIVSSTRYVTRIIAFAVKILLLFVLPPEVFGIYIVALAFSGLGYSFLDLRIGWAVTKFVSELGESINRDIIKKIIISALKINIILGTAGTITILILAEPIAVNIYHNSQLVFPIQLASLFIITDFVFTVISATIRGLRLFKYTSISQIVTNSLWFLLITLLVVLLSMGIVGVILGRLIALIIGSLVGVFFFFVYMRREWRTSEQVIFREKKDTSKKLLSFSLPLYISAIMNFFVTSFDRIFLGIFHLTDVAVLEVAFTISQAIDIAFMILSPGTVFLPIFSELYAKGDLHKFKLVQKYLTKYSAILLIPTCIMLILFAEVILITMFPPSYIVATLAVQIISLKGIILVFHRGECIVAMGRSKNYAIYSAFFGITSLILNILLIPYLGYLGAAIAFIIANLMGILYVNFFLRKQNALILPKMKFFLNVVIVSALASLVPYLILQYIPVNLFLVLISILIGLVIYISLASKFLLNEEERSFFKRLFFRILGKPQ